MKLSTYILIIAGAAALSTGLFNRALMHLAENPIPTWLALVVVTPLLLLGFVAIAHAEIEK